MFREHPLCILRHSLRYLWLLILPAVHSLYTLHTMRRWAGEELLWPAAVIGYGWLTWHRRSIRVQDGIRIREGVLMCREQHIPADSLSAMTIARPAWLRPFRAVRVQADTAADPGKAGLRLLLREKDAVRLRRMMPLPVQVRHCVRYRGRLLRMLAFSGLFSSAFSGAAYAAAFAVHGWGILLDTVRELELEERLRHMLRHPGLLAAGALLVLWGFSFAHNVMRYTGFLTERDGRQLLVRCGLLTRRVTLLRRVNFLDIRQNLVMKLMHLGSLYVSCPGCGGRRGGIAVCLPLLPEQALAQQLPALFPESRLLPQGIRPPAAALPGYLLVPVLLTAAAGAVPSGALRILLLIPAVWWCIIRVQAHRTSSIAFSQGRLCIRYCRGTGFHTVLTDPAHVAKAELRRFFWQRRTCHVTLTLAGDRSVRCTVRHLDADEAAALLHGVMQ